MLSSEKINTKKRSQSKGFFLTCLVFSIFCLVLISCKTTDVKKPLKAEKPSIEKDVSELADAIERNAKRPMPKFSPPKENAADVQVEEVRLDVEESRSQQAKTEQVDNPQRSETTNGKANTSSISENLANRKDGVLGNLGRRDENLKSKIQVGISIDLNSNYQGQSGSPSTSSDDINRSISDEDEYIGSADATMSEDSGGGASNSGLGNALNTIGTTYGKANKQANTQSLLAVKDEIDEDIVARQIREAAHLETDQVLKEKLWLEYEQYRSGLKD